ncbi:nucleoside recognition domain-containing protein [Magnetospirillum moscoviense]|uniref:Spore maturation protein n=1 Tax=Magnetospirillum moscoviense TaxID=1437059 RepID=A0A178MIQ5_9PROT|nr:nucleoside recognition domain-containing protein [Magnetospirillum moscoviense]OAN48433.1 spore maturation protein [Magnetospirillum moscoviense]
MNWVLFLLPAAALVVAAWTGGMETLSTATLAAAEGAVPLALGLVGVMALFLGLMKVAEKGGLLDATARVLSPLLLRLFPEVPPDHPAMGAMVMNVAANLLGLGNAATPFGIRAMEHLESLNPVKGTATNAQVLFLAINTASVTILPTSVIALRSGLGSANPAAVVAPTLIATLVSTGVAILSARLLQGGRSVPVAVGTSAPLWGLAATGLGLAGLIAALVAWGQTIGHWIIPSLVVALLGFGLWRRVAIYEAFVEGAREGFAVAVRIIPYLVAILVAVGMVRASGALALVLEPLGRVTQLVGVPAEAVMMAAMRSLSGSGSFGLLAEQMKNAAIGPDSFSGVLLGTIYGSSETTFYVIAVYFGAVGIRRIRHALACGLIADAAGLVAAVIACRVLIA